MEPIVQNLLFLGVGAVVSAVAFLLKRRIQGTAIDEDLERQHRVLQIHRELSQQKLGRNDVERFLSFLRRRQRHLDSLPLQQSLVTPLPTADGSQAELNDMALQNCREAVADLDRAIDSLRQSTGSERQSELTQMQKHWQVFRDRQAEFVASRYRGGSIVPLIFATEQEILTRERVLQIRRLIEEESHP